MMSLCQYGLNLAINAKDRVQTRFFKKSYMTLLTLMISQGHENIFIPFGCPHEVSLVEIAQLFISESADKKLSRR